MGQPAHPLSQTKVQSILYYFYPWQLFFLQVHIVQLLYEVKSIHNITSSFELLPPEELVSFLLQKSDYWMRTGSITKCLFKILWKPPVIICQTQELLYLLYISWGQLLKHSTYLLLFHLYCQWLTLLLRSSWPQELFQRLERELNRVPVKLQSVLYTVTLFVHVLILPHQLTSPKSNLLIISS